MDKYIKCEDAINQAIEAVDEWDCGYITSREEMIRIYLNDIPAADVRENVRGEWIVDEKENPHGVDWCHCSKCGCKDITQNVSSINYCPNCGADMRPPEVKE